MNFLDPLVRDAVVSRACREAEWAASVLKQPLHASCLLYAIALCKVMAEYGVRCIVQAGTANWPRVTRDQATPDEITQALVGDKLPELHVWNAVCPHTCPNSAKNSRA